jgi:hypothetical protein
MDGIKREITDYGFICGCTEVRIIHSDKKYGVWIDIITPRESIEIRTTPSGLLRTSETKKRKENNNDCK